MTSSTSSRRTTTRSLISNTTFLLFTLTLTILCSSLQSASAAFTAPVERNGDYVDQNAADTWCYYPSALDPATIDVACVGPEKADFNRVMTAHLNTTTSINYFSSSLEVLGGPEWPVNTSGANRKIYLCVSGRAGDYTYQTMCTTVGLNNSLGNGGPSPYCKVQAGQRRVTDGCYIPNQEVPEPEIVGTTTRRPAVVTITRTGSAGATATSLVRDSMSATAVRDSGSASRTSVIGLWISVVSLALLAIRL
ncbi:hypothetical protein BKA70DRAFT_283013 [Coprinopsis sp. MPI-PUGE-AT-0042]|nr:hypothetical protein BKA70DRAFT_283013 [Coprinopsis sp. MPI-PUGE-AT-0042]